MKTNSTTYAEMYEGAIRIPNTSPPQYIYDPTYYYGEIGFKLERTHKLALDKPTVTISIPISMLKLSENDCGCVAAGDHILRALKPYFDELNEEIANRNRPDKENGKYYIYAQITAVGYMLRYLEVSSKERVSDTAELIDGLYGEIEEKGLDFVHSTFFACERWLDMPRSCELAAVINRMRRVDFI